MAEAYRFPDELDEIENTRDFGKADDKAKDDELVVEVVDDTPEQDRNRKPLEENVDDPTDEEVAQYSAKVQDRIKKLTHARHDERREKEKLQRERDELEVVARKAIQERDNLQTQFGRGVEVMSVQARSIADSEVGAAKAKLKAAHEAFDTDAIVEAQSELNLAQMKKVNAENIRYTPPQREDSVVSSQLSAPAAPQAPQLDSKTRKWMADNEWFGEGGDEALTGYALGLHQKLVKQHGEEYARTDEYYSHIDTAMRQNFPKQFVQAKKPPGNVVASATRVAAGPRKVTLTATQAALAKKLGITLQQYAAEQSKLEA